MDTERKKRNDIYAIAVGGALVRAFIGGEMQPEWQK